MPVIGRRIRELMGKRVFITVAEASADQHAGELIACLRRLEPEIVVEGIGGPRMREAGAGVHHESTKKAAMTWRAVLRGREVFNWLRWTRDYFSRNQFDLQICCDSWSMNWHFARLAKERGIPVLYYIAPQTWASREGRIKRLARYTDQVACILPFEEQYFRTRGVNATFVGHPLFDELPAERGSLEKRYPERVEPVIGIIPGSRRSEVKGNLPPLLRVAERILGEYPKARFMIPSARAVDSLVKEMAGDRAEVVAGGFDEVVPRCDLCLVKSGTSTLHVAAFGVPMIVVYRLNPLVWHLAGRWVVKTKKIALVNILAGNIEVAPEFVPWYGSADDVARCAIDMLKHAEKLAEQREALIRVVRPLDRRGASMNVAKMAMEMMEGKSEDVIT